ncbi:MAG: AmmeMemoRadiSam system protein B [Ignavibacteria bacterium]|nr:AmmeMemoRadiSam system protein B [Ignavibacteria bacterium]
MNDLIVPKLRSDIVFEEIEIGQEGKQIVLIDPKGYAEAPAYIPSPLFPIIKMLDGKSTIFELAESVSKAIGFGFDLSQYLNIFRQLDEFCLLETPRFYWKKFDFEYYLQSPIRNPSCAASSYPAESLELVLFLNKLLKCEDAKKYKQNAKAIIVPHIDFRVGREANSTYSTAYNAIKNTDADLFVIFGTAHFGNSDLFMLTKKGFRTPLGIVESDTELIDFMQKDSALRLTIDDLAHRNEHSIELQTVILKHLFGKKEFKILPVLCGSFHNFILKNSLPKSDEMFNKFISKLNESIAALNRKAVFIASADFAHIGRKFGNSFDAETMLDTVKNEDMELIEHLSNCNPDAFFESISKAKDQRSICGISSIYSMLYAAQPTKAEFLKYEQWNELATKSAVTFASLSFFE